MIKIFYKKDYEHAVEMLNLKDYEHAKEIENLKNKHAKEIDDLKYDNMLKQSQEYDPENDPEVLRAEMERLKANHEVEIESWKIQVDELNKEMKTVKADRDMYKKENKQLLKDKATVLAEKTTKKKPGRKKKEVVE